MKACVNPGWNFQEAPNFNFNLNSTSSMEMIIRRLAGTFVLLSLRLAHYHSRYWLWFTGLAGFNLLQSSLTNVCPMDIIQCKLGVG